MQGKLENITIRGIVSAVPERIEPNSEYFELLGEKRVKKQTRMTGVKQRHINEMNQSCADLCYVAAKDLLENIDWKKEEIQVLIFVTQNPTFIMPSTAFFLQDKLGLSKECMVFDINLGCSGFVSGIHVLASLLQPLGIGAKGLILAGDVMRNPNYLPSDSADDFADDMLFGSCGTATAVEISAGNSIYFNEKSDGSRYDTIIRRFYGKREMDGETVFGFAINEMTDYVKESLQQCHCTADDVDYFIFHQAQRFMLKNIALICDIPEEKMLLSLEEYGNTSSASIPLTLCVNWSAMQKKEKNRVLLCGFGVGLASAIIMMELYSDIYTTILETNYATGYEKEKTYRNEEENEV